MIATTGSLQKTKQEKAPNSSRIGVNWLKSLGDFGFWVAFEDVLQLRVNLRWTS